MNFANHHFAALGLSASALVLSACAAEGNPAGDATATDGNGTEQSTESAERQSMSETAWLTVSEEGAVHITFLDPDGRYRDKKEGEVVFQGIWETSAAGDLCFVPDSGAGACWDYGRTDSDGVMRATSKDGRTIELKRVTYTPPPTAEDDAEESGEG